MNGEGKVFSRVERFHQEIKDSTVYSKSIQSADLIFIAAHSQGTPVGILLLDRLVREHAVNPKSQRIIFLGMAGISHGPFPHLRASFVVRYIEEDPARELFDFNHADSFISVTYISAVQRILDSGVHISTVGSWNDQVVPLYSSILYAINHPLLDRALYIDSNDYNADFLSHLVVFGIKLRNAGLSDKGLLIHLSQNLAGSIYGFGTQGHSVIYDELNTYICALAWGLRPLQNHDSNINSNQSAKPSVVKFKAPLLSKLNPYYLPYIMATLLSDNLPFGLKEELQSIVDMFKTWEPKSREGKELKYRLEPIQSKL